MLGLDQSPTVVACACALSLSCTFVFFLLVTARATAVAIRDISGAVRESVCARSVRLAGASKMSRLPQFAPEHTISGSCQVRSARQRSPCCCSPTRTPHGSSLQMTSSWGTLQALSTSRLLSLVLFARCGSLLVYSASSVSPSPLPNSSSHSVPNRLTTCPERTH